MAGWLAEQYGDPCRECGFDWGHTLASARAVVSAGPACFQALLGDNDALHRHPALRWSAKAYVFHVADNLSIWAERLAAAATGSTHPVAPYDDNLLAEARAYEQMPLGAAHWSLGQAVRRWRDAVDLALAANVSLRHPERGRLTVEEVVLGNAHDVAHHQWDVRRCS
jgi:hypothetical protein